MQKMKSVRSYPEEKLKGSQIPSVRCVPDYSYSDGSDAVAILKAARLNLDEWQQNVLTDWLGRYDDETWSASTCGLSIPRQNGKTLVSVARMASGMVMYGEWIVYTSHLQKTSTETFRELRDLFLNKKLKKYVKEIKEALGREEITLTNGARVTFIARTRNGGRGLHGDCLIFDEAQELNSDQQASFIPAISASSNPQTIYIGTPPDEKILGTVFRKLRENAEDSDSIAWTEYSVKEIGDVHDHKRWAETNPALGRRIKESTIASELEQMDEYTFARERLGWWYPLPDKSETIEYVIDKEAWMNCASFDLKPEGKTAYGIKFSPDGSMVCLCGAVIPGKDSARISFIDMKPCSYGLSWLANWLNERYGNAACVVIDGRNGADTLIDKISDVWKIKGSIVKPTSADVVSADSSLINDINEKSITWYKPQQILEDSALTATKRSIGGGWGFGGENALAIQACSLALFGAKTSKRNPSRKMRIG